MASVAMERGTAQWSSRFAFIMAAVGSSVGLGNLWRFSAELGTNGGAAFLTIYVACILLSVFLCSWQNISLVARDARPRLSDQVMILLIVQGSQEFGVQAHGSE